MFSCDPVVAGCFCARKERNYRERKAIIARQPDTLLRSNRSDSVTYLFPSIADLLCAFLLLRSHEKGGRMRYEGYGGIDEVGEGRIINLLEEAMMVNNKEEEWMP